MSTDTAGGMPAADPAPDGSGSLLFGLTLVRAGLKRLADESAVPLEQTELLGGIEDLESVGNVVKALQAELMLAFARGQAAQLIDAGVADPERIERSIAGEVSLACHVSPAEARKRVRTARDLHDGLHHLRCLFGTGGISAYKVATIVGAASHLDSAERAEVDRLLALEDLTALGVGRLRDLTRRFAAEVAPQKFLQRCATARSGRRVTLRPASDGMTDLTAHLPAEQGAACYAALQKAFNQAQTDPVPLTRSRGQVMADTLVERVTGQSHATDVDIQVQVVVPVEALVDLRSPLPAEIPGHGPVPVDLIATTTGRKAWLKLVTSQGVVIGGDSTQRKFTGFLADLIRARDRYRCSELYCDAPIRETDHIQRSADGGPPSSGTDVAIACSTISSENNRNGTRSARATGSPPPLRPVAPI